MRWEQTVGLVRLSRNHPESKENSSGDVGLVWSCRNGLCAETWDFEWKNRRISVRIPGATIKVFTFITAQEHFAAFVCGRASTRHCEFAK
jgi:hypothetical protein